MGKTKQSNNEKKSSKLFIRRIDNHNKFALNFFWKYGKDFFEAIKYSEDDNQKGIVPFRVAFVGFGEYAYEFLKVLCCLGQLPRCRLIIYIFDKYAKERKAKMQKELLDNCANEDAKTEKVASLKKFNAGNIKETESEKFTDLYYHDYPFYEIHFVECDVEKNEFLDSIKGTAKKSFTHIFFMLGSDAANINVAMKVRIAYHRYIEGPKGSKLPIQFYAMVKNDDTTTQLMTLNREKERIGKGGEYVFADDVCRIKLIGSISEMYSFDTIEERDLERCGIQVHKYFSFNKEFWEYYDFAKDKPNDLDLSNIKKLEEFVAKIKKFLAICLKEDYAAHSLRSIIDIQYWDAVEDIIMDQVIQQDNYIIFKIIRDTKLIKKSKQLTDIKLDELIAERNAAIENKNMSEDEKAKSKKKTAQLIKQMKEILKPYFEEYLRPIKWLYDSERLEEDYNRQEYYRRSSKSRALFEKMLWGLGYLDYDNKGEIKPYNVVSEFGVKNNDWALTGEPKNSGNYKPENIPTFKVHRKDKYFTEEPGNNYISIVGQNNKNQIEHINVQWFEVNNILQKRWMVFRWGEGYIPYNKDEKIAEGDSPSKKHRFLKPYIEIFTDEEMRIKHTIDIVYRSNKESAQTSQTT